MAPIIVNLENLPRVGDRQLLAAIHLQMFGPISARTLERLPLPRRIVNGRAIYEVKQFLEWAQARFDAAPMIAGKAEAPRAA